MRILFNTKMHLHFIGIGGIGMSGMAELLYNHGFTISGSDIKKSQRTTHLEKYKNIKISKILKIFDFLSWITPTLIGYSRIIGSG